jgi:hypothetical protein
MTRKNILLLSSLLLFIVGSICLVWSLGDEPVVSIVGAV